MSGQAPTPIQNRFNGIASLIWNYEYFDSPTKEQNAKIALLATAGITLLLTILTRSGTLGTICTLSGGGATFLIIRRIQKDREAKNVPADQQYTLEELKHGILPSSEQSSEPIKGPGSLIEALGKVTPKPQKTDKFANIDATNVEVMKKEVSNTAFTEGVPNFAHGKFRNNQPFILIKFEQQNEYGELVRNFLLFTGPENGNWEAYDSTVVRDKWDVKFQINNKPDIARLVNLLNTGKGELRKDFLTTSTWAVTLLPLPKETN